MMDFLKKYAGNEQDRTVAFNGLTFLINSLTGIIQLVMGIYSYSPWYIVHSIYWLLMGLVKALAIKDYKHARAINDEAERYDFEFDVFKRGGWLICLLGVAYLGISLWMLLTGESRVHDDFRVVLAVAAFAFAKVGVGIYGVVVNWHLQAPIISYFKRISLLNAMVSIVVTQSNLLALFDEPIAAVYHSALLGMLVSGLFLIVGLLMVTKKGSIPDTVDVQ